MDIKRGNNILLSTPIIDGCKRKYTLMKEDFILLKFSLLTPIQFKLGDYVNDGLFELIDTYKPKRNTSTSGYDYELQLDAYYRKWKNKIFKYTQAGQEASWNLTATLDTHLGVFLKNLQALGYKYRGLDFVFSIDDSVENKSQLVSYDNTNMLDALSLMAETWNCEWWVTENIIHFGKCEFGTAVEFEEGVNVEEMSVENNSSTYGTRIIAFGSTRNIPANYRPVDESVVVNGVVQRRLMLPSGTPYIDAYPNMSQEEAVENIVIFDDIYPRRTGTMSDITTKEYTDTVENEDGTETKTKWNAYRFKDNGITFSKDYVLTGNELKIKFESGKLNGLEFAVTFNPDGKPEKIDGSWNPEAQLWEIVRNDDYGRNLPDTILKPEAGDKYVLSGFDTKFVSDAYIPLAEQELFEKATEYAEKIKIDSKNYPCKMMYDEESDFYDVGQKVKLISSAYFEGGSRQSRIIGFEYPLDKPYDHPVYTVGESISYSRLGNIENKLDTLTFQGQTYQGVGGSGVYLIRQNDSTPASDSNVFSALRALKEFLLAKKDSTAEGVITFLKGLLVGDGTKGIDKNGNANLLSLILGKFGITEQGVANLLSVISNKFESLNFVTGILGSGFTLKIDENGDSYIEIDRALFRKSATFVEIIIQSLKHVGGQIILTPASMHCIKVEDGGTYYRCYFRSSDGDKTINNEFVVNDLARSQTFNIKEGVSQNVTNSYYWRKVIAVGDDYIDLSKTDCDTSSTIPQVGDDIIQLGNTSDITRQSAIVLSAFGNEAPYLKLYKGINSYSLSGKEKVTISANDVMIIADSLKFSTGESVKDYIEGMTKDSWVDGVSVVAGTTMPFCNILFKSKVATSNPPCDILQDSDGNYLTDDDGAYLIPVDANGNPYVNSDWAILLDNNSLENRVKTYSNSLFSQADDKIELKVSKDVYAIDQEGVQTRLSTAESSITQQAEQIALRVTRTDFDTELGELQLSDQEYAEAQKELAIAAANATTEAAKTDLQNAIDALDEAKANADDVYTKAAADGKISESEQAAIDAANAAATAAKDLAITTANAYADGIVTDEEERAIQDATDKANAAQQAAIDTASADATTKANNAYTLSKTYTDSQITLTNDEIALKVSKSELNNVQNWESGTSYSFPTMLSFMDMLVQVNPTVNTTSNPPCDILQDNDGAYLTDNDGAYIVPVDTNNNPFFNSTDWVLIMDNYQNTKKLETAESSIVQQAGQITLRATKTELDNGLGEAKSYTDSQIAITNDSITLAVSTSKSYTDAQIAITNEAIALKVSQGDLLATGIDITNKKITVTANSFKIQDNSGNVSALFETGEDGTPRIKAQYIETDELVAKKVDMQATNGLSISITPYDATALTAGIFGTSPNGKRVFSISMSNLEGSTMDSFILRLSQYSGTTEIANIRVSPYGVRIDNDYASDKWLRGEVNSQGLSVQSYWSGTQNEVFIGLKTLYSGITISGYRPSFRMKFPSYNTAQSGEVYVENNILLYKP